jgi:hypothetical protein
LKDHGILPTVDEHSEELWIKDLISISSDKL